MDILSAIFISDCPSLIGMVIALAVGFGAFFVGLAFAVAERKENNRLRKLLNCPENSTTANLEGRPQPQGRQ